MNYNPNIHHRESIRLKDCDYSKEGMYFITICTQNRECLFGNIMDKKMILNDAGKMIEKIYNELPNYFNNIKINDYVIMPNHFHCVIEIVGVPFMGTQIFSNKINENDRATTRVAPTVGDIVGAFKSLTTNEYIRMVKNNELPNFEKRIWQRNYYENIIRNEEIHQKVVDYIKINPLKWQDDKYYVKK